MLKYLVAALTFILICATSQASEKSSTVSTTYKVSSSSSKTRVTYRVRPAASRYQYSISVPVQALGDSSPVGTVLLSSPSIGVVTTKTKTYRSGKVKHEVRVRSVPAAIVPIVTSGTSPAASLSLPSAVILRRPARSTTESVLIVPGWTP